MAKKKRMELGVLEYVSVKKRKNVKALIRELGLKLVSVEKIPDDRCNGLGFMPGPLHY